jgi:hypothetical protein
MGMLPSSLSHVFVKPLNALAQRLVQCSAPVLRKIAQLGSENLSAEPLYGNVRASSVAISAADSIECQLGAVDHKSLGGIVALEGIWMRKDVRERHFDSFIK